MTKEETQAKKWSSLIRKIWDDPSLKEALLANPRQFLISKGFQFPESQAIEVHENTPECHHLVLPEKPPKELSDEVLSHIVAGFSD